MEKYKAKVKNKIILATIVLGIILVFAILVLVEVIPGNKAYVSGFISGFGTVMIISIISMIRALNNEELLRKRYIKENDDREWMIVYKASRFSFVVIEIALAIAITITINYNRAVYNTLCVVFFSVMAINLIAHIYYRRVS